MTEREKDKLITKYLSHKMDGMEKEWFESLVDRDSELLRRIRLEKGLRTVFNPDSKFNRFARILKKAENEYLSPNPRKMSWTWPSVAAAAVLTGIGIFIYLNNPLTPEEIYERHYEHYSVQPIPRNGNLDSEGYHHANGLYEFGNYAQARDSLKKIIAIDSGHQRARLILGLSHLALREFSESQEVLSRLANEQDLGLLHDPVHYHLILSIASDTLRHNDHLIHFYKTKVTDPVFLNKIKDFE